MSRELFYIIFDTSAGMVGILGSDIGLLRVTLPQRSEDEVRRLLGGSLNQATLSPHRFEDLSGRLVAYFTGYRTDFPDKLDLSAATPFQRAVWQAARVIPYGETRSYSWVAGQAGNPKAARATGQALGANRIPVIIPCHRVIAYNGGLGGFGDDLEMKKYLLTLEMSDDIR